MIQKSLLVGLMVAVTMVGGFANGQAPRTAKDPDPASGALAERFFDLAQQSVPQQAATMPHRQQMSALLEAAWRLSPEEPRFARPLAGELMQQRQFGRALTVLNALRKVRPDDRRAQIQAIEAYLGQMQTLDRRLDYLKSVVAAESVPPEVRSIAAVEAAKSFDQKHQPDEFRKMVELALKLDPLNLSALIQQTRLSANATQAQRLEVLLQMLRSQPAQVEVLLGVARWTANAGLLDDSIRWYEHAAMTARRVGSPLVIEAAVELCAQHVLAGQTDVALQYLNQLIPQMVDRHQALILRALALDQKGDEESAKKDRNETVNLLTNGIQTIRGEIGAEQATTRPVTDAKPTPLPDLSGDIERFKAHPKQQNAYLAILGDLAWFEVFFNSDAGEGERLHKYFMQLSEAAEEDNRLPATFDARMSGWIFLLRDQLAEAKVKLSAAEKDDVLAALGMIRVLAETDKPAAKAAAQQLLNRAPAGILGVQLFVKLKDQEVKVQPNERAAALKPVLDTFPMEWLKIIDNPLMFYSLRGEPVRIAVPFGQPLLANITIQNTSNYDLTIGRDGVIQPELWFDVQLGGVFRDRIPNAVVESIPEQIVLKPRQRINFTARLDQGLLRDKVLAANPTPPVGMMVTMRSNVQMTRNGMMTGPAGQSAEFRRMMERSPFVLNEQTFRGVMDVANSTRGGDRIRAMHLLHELASGMIASALKSRDEAVKRGDEAVRQSAEAALKSAGERSAETMALFRKNSFDEDPDVKAYAAFFFAREAGQDRPQEVRTMLKDAAWQVRLLGLVTMRIPNPTTREPLIDIEQQKAMMQELLDKETEPHVRDYAAAALELLKSPATPPATQPAPRG